jgi:hypothetical protein
MKKIMMLSLILITLSLVGCKTIITQKDVVLLPEDRIYTVPAGTKVHLFLDKKDLGELAFPYDMKFVHSSILERNEQQLNDLAFKQVKAERDNAKKTGIVGGILALLGSIAGIWAKSSLGKKKTADK